MIRKAIQILALFSTGLASGSAYTTFFWFDPSGATIRAWVAHLQQAVPLIGIPLFLVNLVAVLATVASAVLGWKERKAFRLLAVASVALGSEDLGRRDERAE